MKTSAVRRFLISLIGFLALGVAAQAATISGDVGFLGGLVGSTWTVTFTSDVPGVTLDQVSVSLSSPNYFDTNGTPLTYQDFTPVIIADATGYNGVSPNTQAGRDGATALTIYFTDFDSGELFTWGIDVDQTTPTSGIGSALARETTLASEIAGTIITLTFSAEGYDDLELQTTLAELTVGAGGSFEGTMVQSVPEPATIGLIGLGLCGVAFFARRRKRS